MRLSRCVQHSQRCEQRPTLLLQILPHQCRATPQEAHQPLQRAQSTHDATSNRYRTNYGGTGRAARALQRHHWPKHGCGLAGQCRAGGAVQLVLFTIMLVLMPDTALLMHAACTCPLLFVQTDRCCSCLCEQVCKEFVRPVQHWMAKLSQAVKRKGLIKLYRPQTAKKRPIYDM
jgi:hypothetical protein